MAFVAEFQENPRWTHFSFFASGGTNGAVSESLNPDGAQFRMTEVRLHFSVAFAAVEDFIVRLSSAHGSAHNITLISQALSGLTDYLWQYSQGLHCLSDDQLVMGWSQASGANIGGLNVQGWAVFG
jgi:hypothetical protein